MKHLLSILIFLSVMTTSQAEILFCIDEDGSGSTMLLERKGKKFERLNWKNADLQEEEYFYNIFKETSRELVLVDEPDRRPNSSGVYMFIFDKIDKEYLSVFLHTSYSSGGDKGSCVVRK